jgi:hypothetical protein
MRCPVCKAENHQGPQCRRCKADLALLFALEGQRGRELGAARRSLSEGRWSRAEAHAAEANWLRRDEESLRLLAVARLFRRDYAGAWRCYRELRGETVERGAGGTPVPPRPPVDGNGQPGERLG